MILVAQPEEKSIKSIWNIMNIHDFKMKTKLKTHNL